MDRYAEVVAQIVDQGALQHPFASSASSIDISRFEGFLAQEEATDDDLLVNPSGMQDQGMTSAMHGVVSKFSAANASYKGALEDSVKALGALDPMSPRASVVMLETAINMSINEAHMKFASKIVGASKEALNTLLRSQG
jgi:hypothetical protein